MTMLGKLDRTAILALMLAIALMAFAACSTGESTPTTAPAASGDNMADDSMSGDDAMMDDESMSDDSMSDDSMSGDGMTDDESMSDDAMTDDESMSGDDAMSDDDSMMYPDGEEKSLVTGWYQDQQVRYYDFGMNSATNGSVVATAPIYVFIHGFDADGNPEFVEGQHNVVNVKPGDPGYSDLWQVMLVTVPDDYEADSIKSAGDVMAMGYEVTPTEMYVNCPIVDEGTTLEGGESLTQGWYKGEEVFYPDFGVNPANAIPIWVFATGFDADGNPQFVEGQQNVIDAVPGDPGYSAFWQVNIVVVDEGYEANSVTSREDIQAMGYEVMQTNMVVNCPVTEYPGA